MGLVSLDVSVSFVLESIKKIIIIIPVKSFIMQEPAEAGVIEKIVLSNFMCHKYLEVRFGPKLNFIIGHNGSESHLLLAKCNWSPRIKCNFY